MAKVANIGKKQRITRGVLGALLLLFFIYLTLFYIEGFTPFWYIVLFVIVYNGLFLLLEARTGVCPINTYREKQSMSGWLSLGKEDLEDKSLSIHFKEISRKNSTKALVGSLIILSPLFFL
ncbi:MAG: DUF2892 domain-containing protein [Candidatus Spechtbacterales bacterium]|nr:DUF2892 domain-containing protein [Candidatus Spechtbacterales bacterium]